jgi:hypothetical protein
MQNGKRKGKGVEAEFVPDALVVCAPVVFSRQRELNLTIHDER